MAEDEEPNITLAEVWTPDQQLKELTRRVEILRSDMDLKVDFQAKPDDVILAIAPKNGVTWLLHICHQIRMQGREPDFEYQALVVTWIEGSNRVLGVDPATKPQPAKPHIFVTHLTYPLAPVGGRRLFCIRDQKDVMVSAYHFLNSHLSLKERVSLPIFSQALIQAVEPRLKDLLIWWEHRHDDDLLLLFFDDLKEDHAGSVRRIAKFIGVVCDEDVIAHVVHTTAHSEMVRHHSKFDSLKYAMMVAERIGDTLAPRGEFVGRVRKNGGKSGQGKEKLPVEVQQRIDQIWQEIVTSKLGFQNLQEMRKAWKEDQLANRCYLAA